MKKYVAYVSTYTMKGNRGIMIYDVDMKEGRMVEKGSVEITNSSYLTRSHDGQYLYSITDLGVQGYRILPDGMLEKTNMASINGMRGCYLSTSYDAKFLFVAGYHDGKITVLRLLGEGLIGEITDEIYVQGFGNVADRSFRPHANCAKVSRDNRFLFVADVGTDHVNVYELNQTTGKLRPIDIIRSEMNSGPRHIVFSRKGNYLYIVHEIKNTVDVYSFRLVNDMPEFERIQSIPTINDYHAEGAISSALKLSKDGKYLVSSNAGDNSVIVYEIDQNSGMLSKKLCLPISGDYPKDASLFPDNQHLVSLNHASGTMTFFNVNMEKGLLAMNTKELKIEKPNCIIFHELQE